MSDKNSGLIMDGEKIRNCPSNWAVLPLWRVALQCSGYRRVWTDIKIDLMGDFADGIKALFRIAALVLLFPAIPFIRACFMKSHAKKMSQT